MRLNCPEQIAVKLPPGTKKALAEVAARREVSPTEYLRTLVLTDMQKRTGFSAVARAREALADNHDQGLRAA